MFTDVIEMKFKKKFWNIMDREKILLWLYGYKPEDYSLVFSPLKVYRKNKKCNELK